MTFATAAVLTADTPPQLTPARIFTVWEFDPYLILGVLLVAACYVAGIRRMRRRGDHWPVGRSILFLGGGLGTILVATTSSLGAYDDTLFSMHMVQHMLLSMVAPIFLALGAPVTLALRTMSVRWRRRLVAVLHSQVAKVLTFPLVTWVLFVTTPFALYFTSWYPATLTNTYLHEMLHVHLVVVGCLFFWPLIGLDPVPGRMAYPFRMIMMFLALPFHAILGLSIMMSSHVIAGDYYRGLGLTWTSPHHDQNVGGGILWASGDLVGLLMFGALFVQWVRWSERESEREDRRLDRLEAEQAARRAAAEGA
jgi:putative copper resistance protein D